VLTVATRTNKRACTTNWRLRGTTPMNNRVNGASAPAPSALTEAQIDPWPAPPVTTAERLRVSDALGKRIDGYIRVMCQVGDLAGTSAEAKERAVAAFHDRLVIADRQLGRIQEELRLG
jgi:hypothetical protein